MIVLILKLINVKDNTIKLLNNIKVSGHKISHLKLMDEKQLIKEQFVWNHTPYIAKVQYMISPYFCFLCFCPLDLYNIGVLSEFLFIHFSTFVSQIGSNSSCCYCCNCALNIVARHFIYCCCCCICRCCSCKDSLYRSFN